MTQILAIDTASAVIGVAWRNGSEVVQRTARVAKGSDQRVAAWIQELAGIHGGLSRLDGVAVAHGPGAFTGLRVGLASATAIAMALDLPVFEVSSMEHRASAAGKDEVGVWLDARKDRVYAQLWKNGVAVSAVVDREPDAWLTSHQVAWFTGEGAMVYADIIGSMGGQVSPEAATPAMAELARIGEERFARGEGVSADRVGPLYIRAPDAVPPKVRRYGRLGLE